MDFFQKFPTEKVVTHLKSFLGVIWNIWHGRNACDKKIIQHLLEAQCVVHGLEEFSSYSLLSFFLFISGKLKGTLDKRI